MQNWKKDLTETRKGKHCDYRITKCLTTKNMNVKQNALCLTLH